jgi:hypothetical protein
MQILDRKLRVSSTTFVFFNYVNQTTFVRKMALTPLPRLGRVGCAAQPKVDPVRTVRQS